MSVKAGKAEEFGQDKELGRLVETRVADPTGRWRDVRALHEALMAQGANVLTVEWGDAGQGDEVVVTADQAVTDLLTALPVPVDPREEMASKIAAVSTMDELKAILTADILPKLRLEGEHR